MDDKGLIQVVLGIHSPWFVKDINLNTSGKKMDIHLEFIKGSRFPCPVCNKLSEVHDTKERTWRHLDFFHYESYLHARVPRTKCKEHGVKLVNLPWSRPNTGFTLFFEALIVTMSDVMPVSAVADMVSLNEESVWRILAHYVNKAVENVDLSEVDTIGIDEISVKKGHQYITLFYDFNEKRVIHIEHGKGKDALKRFKKVMEDKIKPNQIKYISMDMSPAFISGAKEYFPEAKIVFDKFHVIKMANDTIDKVRRKEQDKNKALGKTKFIWLKNPENLSEREMKKLHSIKNLDTKTAKAYQFRIALQRLWSIKHPYIVREYFNKWYYWATHSNIDEIVKLARTIDKHFIGIMEAIKRNLNNGVVEGMNNKIKTAFKRSYGFKNEKYRNTIIYLVAGKLDLPTQC
jgi:transposase